MVIVLVLSAVVVALLDAEMAGILQRYFADFSFMLLLVVVLLVFILNENMDHASTAYSIAAKGLPVLVACSLAYSLLLCLVAETGWYSDAYPWAYQSIIHMFQFWT